MGINKQVTVVDLNIIILLVRSPHNVVDYWVQWRMATTSSASMGVATVSVLLLMPSTSFALLF